MQKNNLRPKKNICLFKLPRPTLIFTPPPPPTLKVFMVSGKRRREMSCPSIRRNEAAIEICMRDVTDFRRPYTVLESTTAES